jgi:hypothetical protein
MNLEIPCITLPWLNRAATTFTSQISASVNQMPTKLQSPQVIIRKLQHAHFRPFVPGCTRSPAAQAGPTANAAPFTSRAGYWATNPKQPPFPLVCAKRQRSNRRDVRGSSAQAKALTSNHLPSTPWSLSGCTRPTASSEQASTRSFTLVYPDTRLSALGFKSASYERSSWAQHLRVQHVIAS